MARIIYALSGQGRGHTSRGMAIADGLRRRGHEVMFCCGGVARDILTAQGEAVLPVPTLRQVVVGNAVRIVETIRANAQQIRHRECIIEQVGTALLQFEADLLISDFEVFSARAAERVGVPVLSLDHQQLVTEGQFHLPGRYWLHAAAARQAIRLIAPRRPRHVLITSFFFPHLKRPAHATLIPPIIRPEVQAATPVSDEEVLVYCTDSRGMHHLLDTLASVDARFVLYNVPRPEDARDVRNITFKQPALAGFLDDLSRCRAVICTAGFTLISEALYLGKPLLVSPSRGQFEQTLNAMFLRQEGLGEAVLDRQIDVLDIEGFLSRLESYSTRRNESSGCGNEQALDVIEACCGQDPQHRLRHAVPWFASKSVPATSDPRSRTAGERAGFSRLERHGS